MITEHFSELVLSGLGKWVSLHHDNPRVGGAYASEVAGCVRCEISWTEPVGGTVWNLTPIEFFGMSATTAKYLGVWDTSDLGNLHMAQALPKPVVIPSGGSYRLPELSVAVSLY